MFAMWYFMSLYLQGVLRDTGRSRRAWRSSPMTICIAAGSMRAGLDRRPLGIRPGLGDGIPARRDGVPHCSAASMRTAAT